MVEAALFAAGKPLSLSDLAAGLNLTQGRIKELIEQLRLEYSARESAIELVQVLENKYAIQVKTEYVGVASNFSKRRELSSSLIKTLAMVAYQQPITQAKIVKIRGLMAYDHIKALKRRGLIKFKPFGRTKILHTTRKFCEYFGLETDEPKEIRVWIEKHLKKEIGETSETSKMVQ